MARRLTQVALVFVVIFAAAQLVRPERLNPVTDPGRTIQAHMGTASTLVPILASCQSASEGRMPGPYTLLRPETRLSAGDVEIICAAARQAGTNAANGRREQ